MRKLTVLIAALAIVAASCGDRGDDPSAAGGGGGGGDGSSTTEAPGGGEQGAGDWGDLEGVCGPNEGGGAVPADDAEGVSDDTIKVGTVADPGFAGRPGLNQELFDAGTAFVAWCNAAGGINGKQLELTLHDAKVTDYQPAIRAACDSDFALVGGGALQDNLWEDVGAACGLIDIAGFAVTPQKAGVAEQDPTATRTVQPVPNPGDRYPVGGARLVQEEFPDAGAQMGFMYSDFQTILSQKAKEEQAFRAIGNEVVHEGVYNLNGEANWKPFATALQADGVQFLKFIGEPSNAGSLEAAMDQVGYVPDVRLYETNMYDQSFLDSAGPAANGAFLVSVFTPLEEADENPATARYVDNLEETGGKQAVLGLQSTSAWLLFATLAKACDLDDDLTRTCILERAAEVTDWTAGGLHAPSSPATNEGPTCQMVLQVVDGRFERWAPTDEPFSCSDDNVVEVDPS
jgi:ABC-type branched-subunit amino acid transport system substrate-binding protein